MSRDYKSNCSISLSNRPLSATQIAGKVKAKSSVHAASQEAQRVAAIRGEIEHKDFEQLAGTFQTHDSINKTTRAHTAIGWVTCFMCLVALYVLNS